MAGEGTDNIDTFLRFMPIKLHWVNVWDIVAGESGSYIPYSNDYFQRLIGNHQYLAGTDTAGTADLVSTPEGIQAHIKTLGNF